MFEDDLSTQPAPTPATQHDERPLVDVVREAREARYDHRGELARGGMGVVERVGDAPLRRELARKRIRADLDGDDLARLLLREARVTAWLSHPNIVPVHDLDLEGDDLFFTMRLVGGQTLDDWIRRRDASMPVDWDTLLDQLDAMVRVCDALGFAHRRGVVHSDIKPANIMVGDDGEVYLMDWGVARLMEPLPGDDTVDNASFEGLVFGTASYMPPEQAFGMPLDQRADIFSMGAVLFHILTGRPPYTNDENSRAIGKARAASPKAPSSVAPWVPPALDRIVVRAMQRLADDRYPSVLEMKADLVRFIRGGTNLEAVVVHEGDVIVRKGEPGRHAYVIETGRVKVEIDGVHIREMGPGDVFGEMAVMRESPRTATVIALEETTLRRIGAQELLAELDAMKPWMGSLVRCLAQRLSGE